MINIVIRELMKSSTKSLTTSNPPTGYSQQKPSSLAAGEDSTGRRLFIFSTDQALIKDPKFLEYVMLYEQVMQYFAGTFVDVHIVSCSLL